MKTNSALDNKNRKGFTLVELVVVILVMGIVAAVAAPKMFDTATDARDNSTRHSLTTVRNAIQLYKAQNGEYPGQDGDADLKTDLADYIQGQFPKSQITDSINDGSVSVVTGALTPDSLTDWKYAKDTGEFIINLSGYETF